jgi:hypothetical protein
MRLPIPPSGRLSQRDRISAAGSVIHPSSRDHHSWQWHLYGCADTWLHLQGLHFG